MLLTEGVYLSPHRPGRCADRQRLLGAVLPGTWHSAGRTDALGQDCWRRRRQLQHVLQRDRRWQTCAAGRVRGSGAHSCRWVCCSCDKGRRVMRDGGALLYSNLSQMNPIHTIIFHSFNTHFSITVLFFWHYATSRKVAGSIPDGVTGIFHWHNPSGRTMALGLTPPLTEMITRNISRR